MNTQPPPPVILPFPREELDGATIAFIEHRNCEMVREIGRINVVDGRLSITILSLPDDPYRRIARTFLLTQAQADTIQRLPTTSTVGWECGSVLSGNEIQEVRV